MKKVLYVTNMFPSEKHPFDGIFIYEQIEAIKKNYKFESQLFLIEGIHKGKFQYLKSVFSIIKAIKSFQPDIIHIHYGLAGLFLLFYKPKEKVIITLHGSDFNEKGGKNLQVWLSKKIIKKADLVLVQNYEMLESAILINSNTEIITCGVDTDFFVNHKYPKVENSLNILFPSSPNREVKNYPLFLKIVNLVEKELNKKVKVSVIENASRTEVVNLMNEADVLLMTSYSEGSPQSVKEALSCGLAVVSVPVGNVSEMLSGIDNCFVSKTFEPEELLHLVIKSLNADREQIRKKFLEKSKYTNNEIANRIIYHYEN